VRASMVCLSKFVPALCSNSMTRTLLRSSTAEGMPCLFSLALTCPDPQIVLMLLMTCFRHLTWRCSVPQPHSLSYSYLASLAQTIVVGPPSIRMRSLTCDVGSPEHIPLSHHHLSNSCLLTSRWSYLSSWRSSA
jgi:hypothetical protein